MNMKNILIVSENFTYGGLETQIYTMYQESLKNKKANLFFSFGNYNNEWDFPKEITYTGFNYNFNCTVSQFISDVDRLLKIIEKHKINIIHVHPFFSVYPAVIAAQIAQIPVVYTYHGYGSINFPFDFSCQYLLEYCFDELFSHIFFVYNDISKYMNGNFRIPTCSFLPNPINLDDYNLTKPKSNHEWVYVSRISADKIDGIELIMNNLDNFNISKLHIYGTGDKKEWLKDFIASKKLSKRVILHDYSYKINEEINGKYNGIFGMGRAALEGASMGLPVCIVGYGKIYGIIKKDNIKEVIDNNFAPIFLKEPSKEKLQKQFEIIANNKYKCDFYDEIKNNADVKNVFKKYLKELDRLVSPSNNSIKKLYRELKELKDTNQFIYNSQEVNDLIFNILGRESINFGLNRFAILNREIERLTIDKYGLKKHIETLENTIKILDDREKYLSERLNNINIKNIVVNSFNIFIRKIRRKKK